MPAAPPLPPQPQAPFNPQLFPPLMDNEQRTLELSQSLDVAFLGQNSWEDIQYKNVVLERLLVLDKRVLDALVFVGYSSQSVLAKRGEIRDAIFYGNNDKILSWATLDRHVQQIYSVGVLESRPFKKVQQKIRNYSILL